MGQVWSILFPPPPILTERNLPNQAGKVFVITGASSGVGRELASVLYHHNAKVYIAARSKTHADEAIASIRRKHPASRGQIKFLFLDLADLSTIQRSAEEFLSAESKLDVLWNNAGVMLPPQGSVTTQGYELQLGVNNVGHFLFTKLLYPALRNAAQSSTSASVRVVWVSSSAALRSPSPPVDLSNMDYHNDESAAVKYARSKAGNVLHASEFARRSKVDGIISVSLHPGLLKTNLQRWLPYWQLRVFGLIAYTPNFGAYTELYAGLHEDITAEHSGAWVLPWGRMASIREDLNDPWACEQYWNWTERQVEQFIM